MLRLATAVIFMLVLGSFLTGCSWFRSRPEYQGVEISKPLMVPADLSKPKNRDALQIPSKTLLGENAKSPERVANFVVDAEQVDVWKRLGVALDSIEGVEVLNKADSIKSYEVRYNSEVFLISAQANANKTRVVAIGVDGAVQQSGASSQLLSKLKAILQK